MTTDLSDALVIGITSNALFLIWKMQMPSSGSISTRQTFKKNMWSTRDGRMLARFWSRSDEVERELWELFGLKPVPPDESREVRSPGRMSRRS